MKTLNFSQNWNRKLDSPEFTTIRLLTSNYWKVGDRVTITLGKSSKTGRNIATGFISRVRVTNIFGLTESDAMVDVGKPLSYLIQLLTSMYKFKVTDWGKQELVILTVRVTGRFESLQEKIVFD